MMSLVYLLGYFALAINVVHGHNSSFSLEMKNLLLCQAKSLHSDVSLYRSEVVAVQADLTNCEPSSVIIDQYNGFRVHTSSSANGTYPVAFIARQNTNGILSFSIPFQPNGFTVSFFDVSRTVCPVKFTESNSTYETISPPLFYIDVFTSSPQPWNYSLSVEPVINFTLHLDETYSTFITPSSPQIFYFKMPDGINEVTVEVKSPSRRCAIASVQNVTCPVNDLLENARSIGIFQTMSTSAYLTVDMSQVNDREFLLVLIDTNYSVCHYDTNEPNNQVYSAFVQDEGIANSTTYGQALQITIRKLQPISQYLFAILLPLLVVFPPFSLLTFFVIFDCFPKARCEPHCRKPCKLSIKCICPVFFLCWYSNKRHECTCPPCMADEEVEEREMLTDSKDGLTGYQSVPRKDEPTTGPSSQGAEAYPLSIESKDNADDSSEPGKQFHVSSPAGTKVDESRLKLPSMNKREYGQLEDQYCLYGWNTVTVGIFYALPALQLVLSEQKFLNLSGDQDECYYNFRCAHPLSFPLFGVTFHFNTFNNVWSNIGYVLLGFLFIIVALVRRYLYRRQRGLNREYVDSHGIPQFFGIYFAMGFALILEGFMSSFYHICPSDANFQFDTAFMFIIGGLLLVKVFQKRHPDIHANAFIAFFSFAVIIFCTLVGIYFGRKNPIPVRLLIFLLALLLLFIFLVSFYYFHNWKWKKEVVVTALNNIKDLFSCRSGPRHRVRFVKLTIAFCLNFILAVLVVALYHNIDVPTAVLAFFLLNLLYFLIVYVALKLWFLEPLTWLALVLPVAIAAAWGAAFYFFKVVPVTHWKLTPAESREINKECALLGFYDNHDIWHFLSAFGMFFAFLFLLVLDDGVADMERQDLNVF